MSQDAAVLAAFALLPTWRFPCPVLIKCVGLNRRVALPVPEWQRPFM